MSIEDNKQIARRAFEEMWNQGKPHVIDELYEANQVSYGLGVELRAGRAPHRQRQDHGVMEQF